MTTSYLVFPHTLRKANLSSATNQAGARSVGSVEGAANAGDITVAAAGAGAAAALVALTASGNIETATYKWSADGGSNYKGRQAITTWDGNGAAVRTPYAGAAGATAALATGALVAADLDNDGVPDALFLPVQIAAGWLIYKSTDLSGTGAWTQVCAAGVGSIVWHHTRRKFYGLRVIDAGTDDGIGVYVSADECATWSLAGRLTTHAQAGTPGNIIELMSGRLCAVYSRNVSGDDSIGLVTSADGVNWSAENLYHTGGVDLITPWIVQNQGGVTLCVYLRNTATVAVELVKYTEPDPATEAPVASGLTMFAADANHTNPTICNSPDGTVYIVVRHATSTKIQYSFLKGVGTFPAVATLLDTADTLSLPVVSMIGGALFCAYINGSNYDAELVMSKYWTTFAAGGESWTSKAGYPQWLYGTTWIFFGGSAGVVGDTFTVRDSSEYGAHRMMHGTPRRPARSIGDAADWAAVFDAGSANALIPYDTICAKFNGHALKIQSNATDSWATPTGDDALSFIRETIAAANRTLAGCEMTRTSGTFTAHKHIAERLRFGTSGEVFSISDNDTTKAWCQAQDIDGATGDAQILSPRAWAAVTQRALRFLRVLAENQQTYENYYELCVAVGLRTAFTGLTSLRQSTRLSAQDFEDSSGGIHRTTRGPSGRAWVLSLYMMSAPKFHELKARILNHGSAPFVLIPDASDPYDWAYVLPELETEWKAKTTTIKLVEIV